MASLEDQKVSFQKQNLVHDLTKGVVLGTFLFIGVSLTSDQSRQVSIAFAWVVMAVYGVIAVALFERYFREPRPLGDSGE
ncbi:hypothetical protein HT576_09130 [Haloterrigena sp. SYSU A121-1]|uniref:Uncharacterized protein n=1 Tax=Haloterrigena gelatinilytica TaxID=2741724 RepID=A0A8J8KFN6_9EURY|nr:hypothetical protein [Haloterrigena gelatinilytica]NUB91182.1 hypothetical protein [Haloterrigena gelatinilytica]